MTRSDRASLALGMACVALCLSSRAMSQNVVPNGGFEAPLGKDGTIPFWETPAGAAGRVWLPAENGGFELGDDLAPECWWYDTGDNPGVRARWVSDAGLAADGERCVELAFGPEAGKHTELAAEWFGTPAAPLASRTRVRLRCLVRGEGLRGIEWVELQMRQRGPTGESLSVETAAGPHEGTFDWTPLEITCTTVDGAAAWQPALRAGIEAGAECGGRLWFDGLSFESVDAPGAGPIGGPPVAPVIVRQGHLGEATLRLDGATRSQVISSPIIVPASDGGTPYRLTLSARANGPGALGIKVAGGPAHRVHRVSFLVWWEDFSFPLIVKGRDGQASIQIGLRAERGTVLVDAVRLEATEEAAPQRHGEHRERPRRMGDWHPQEHEEAGTTEGP